MVGYLPDKMRFSALQPSDKNVWLTLLNDQPYHQCKNGIDYNVCNWMVPASDNHVLCASCRLNHLIPNLSEAQNVMLWYRVEQAKRRLLYTLHSLNMPVIDRTQDPERGLCFEFLQSAADYGEFDNTIVAHQNIITGHCSGKITINLCEAEHDTRIKLREKMNERYRTLLGHFRHESGHYYWEYLINKTPRIDSFRQLFGDERQNYWEALNKYYEQGPPESWQSTSISAYASAHPWEDWAETWAHYLHMIDTVETAHDFGFSIHGNDISAPGTDIQMGNGYFNPTVFDVLFEDWCRLSVAMNALNRSMGLDDAYPFVISSAVLDKLRYIHHLILEINHY